MQMKEKKGIKAWLKTKLNAFGRHSKRTNKADFGPLTTAYTCNHQRQEQSKPRAKQLAPPAFPEAQEAKDDDLSQARASSDQTLGGEATTTVSRQDDYVQSRHPSIPEAAAHMAALRELLLTHISETHDAGSRYTSSGGQIPAQYRHATAPSPCAVAGQQLSSELPAGQATVSADRQAVPGTSSRGSRQIRGAGLTPDHAHAADPVQLLELVEVLISDHRTSLLERQRLQQQLDSAQQALLAERMDKERAAALADVRAAEAHQAQESLASTVAVVERLQHKRNISTAQIRLPPPAAACTSGSSSSECIGDSGTALPREDSTLDTDRESKQHSSRRCKQARITAALNTKQDTRAAAAGQTPAAACSRHGSRQTGSNVTPSKAVSGKAAASCSPSVLPRDAHAAALSLRPSARAAAAARGAAAAVKPAAAGAPGKVRRLLSKADADSRPADGRVGRQRSQAASEVDTADLQRHHAQEQQQLALLQPGATTKAGHQQAASAAAKRGSQRPSAQEQLFAGPHADAVGQDAPHPHGSDTLASSLSVSIGPDAMLGVTRQQLQQVLQRPWLQATSHAQHAAAPADTGTRSVAGSDRAGAGAESTEGEGSAAQFAGEYSGIDARSLLAMIDSSCSSGNGSAYNSQPQPLAGPPAETSSSSAVPSAAAGDTGRSTMQPRRQSPQQMAAACSSNGSSWPGMKASAAVAAGPSPGTDALPGLQPPPVKPSPVKARQHANIRLRGRSRAQPQQLSTSLESAATLPLQGPTTGNERSSHGSSVADPALLEEPAAAGWTGNSLEMVQEEQQQWPQQQQEQEQQQQTLDHLGRPSSSSSLTADSSVVRQGTGQHHDRGDSSGGPCAGASSAAAAAAEKVWQQTKQRRRWSAPNPEGQELLKDDAAGPPAHQRQRQDGELQEDAAPRHTRSETAVAAPSASADATTSAPPAAGPPAPGEHQTLSKKHLQALAADTSLASSGELSAATSDLACMSITSAATGCTTLSGLAGVYLQHPAKPAKVCPRPSFVPKLQLQSISGAEQTASSSEAQPQQQQQQTQQLPQHEQHPQHQQLQCKDEVQLQGSTTAVLSGRVSTGSQQGNRPHAVLTPCSSTGHHLGSARSYLTAEELADMTPLMAHPSSSRARRRSSTPGTAAAAATSTTPPPDAATPSSARSAGGAAAGATTAAGGAGARCTPRASMSSNGSGVSTGTSRGAAAAAAAMRDSQHSQGHAARITGGGAAHAQLLGRAAPGEASSSGVNRSPGVLSTRAYRPSSGGGSNAGLAAGPGYWGSSAGSNPASENPSRQPTPRVSDNNGAPPSSAGVGAGASAAGRGGVRSRPSTAGNPANVDAGSAASAGATGSRQQSAAQAGSNAAGAALATVDPATAGAVPGVTSHGVVLTAIPPPCAASATAAAASSFMTMRPAHLYRSVSTVYAMYSPLMGNLRALGHSRAAGSTHSHLHPTAGSGAEPGSGHASVPSAGAGDSSNDAVRPEIPTFAGLAASMTTTLLEPQPGQGPVPEGNVAAAVAAAAAAHECHWQALLLGGCPPVPEDGAVQWLAGQQAAAAAPAGNAAHGTEAAAVAAAAAAVAAAHAAAAGGFAGEHPSTRAAPAAAAAGLPSAAAAVSSRSQHSQQHSTSGGRSSGTPVVQQASASVSAQGSATAVPADQLSVATGQPQVPPRQHRPQMLQVEVPAFIERDVVERGPVLPPNSLTGGPIAISPHRARLSSPTRQLSPLTAAAAREAGDTAVSPASSPLLAAADADVAVGPLTAASPTRLQRQRGHGSHSQQGASSSSRPPAGPHRHRQQHRQQQQQQDHWQHQQQQQPHRPRLAGAMSPGRAAAIEAAAASVAAHVAAAAQLINRQEQRLSNSQLTMQPEAPAAQQHQQQEAAAATRQQGQQTEQHPQRQQQQVGVSVRRQQSQAVQVQMDQGQTGQTGMQTPQAKQQQQQQGGTLELDCSLCCFSPMSTDNGGGGGGWIREASPNALVAAASATVDTLMHQAELMGMQYRMSQRGTEQQQQQQRRPQALFSSSSSIDARLPRTSSSDMGLVSPSNNSTQLQQYYQQLPPAGRPAHALKPQRTPGGHHKRRSRARWHQPQHHTNPLFTQQLGDAGPELHCQQEHRTPPRTSRSTSRTRPQQQHGSASKTVGLYRTVRTPPMSPGAAAALEPLEELLVLTYQNPLLALEAAGLPDLGASLDTELVSAALLPALAQQASDASSFNGGGCNAYGSGVCGVSSCDAAAGVSAAAVPVHMTPLAKERSVRVMGQQAGLSGEASGAGGGQLHWNPLYNPTLAQAAAADSLQ